MSILRQIGRVIAGAAPEREETAALLGAYTDCLHRADGASADAELAPDPGSRRELLDLARVERDLASWVWESLADRLPAPPAHVPSVRRPTQRNHWARLVLNLETHRAAMQQYRDLATRLTEPAPRTAAVFERLSTAQAGICRRLRALIARADPQAID